MNDKLNVSEELAKAFAPDGETTGQEGVSAIQKITNPKKDIVNNEFSVGEPPVLDRYRLVELPNVFGELEAAMDEVDVVPLDGSGGTRVLAQHATYCGKTRG